MGLSWISPLYLSGALLLALPVLIHLVQRHHLNGIKFPSLMFLKQVPQREKRHFEIRNWLLLLLRCLLLLLVVIAFARPFFTGGSEPVALDPGRKDSVIVIDQSYSMRIAERWQQAQETALKLVDEKQPRDRIGVVIFDDSSQVLSDLTTNTENLRTVIGRQSPGLKTTRLRIGLEQAARLLADSNASARQILLISDFQAAAMKPGDAPRISRDIELKTFAVDVADAANATISSIVIGPSRRGTADEFSLKVKVTNHAATTLEQQIRLVVNGRELARRDLRLEPGQVVAESFDDLGTSGGLVRGVVSLDNDALALDNQAFFVYSSKQQVPVLIIEGKEPRINQSIYLENALGLARNPVFTVTRLRWKDLKAEDLAAWAVIIINDASIPGGVLGSALQDYVAAGGGLMVATGNRVQGNWPSGEDGFLPGALLRQVDSKPGVAHGIGEISDSHPIVNDAGAGDRIDLSTARVFSYRNLEPDADDRVLARYSDGGVALLETTRQRGRVLVLTTTLDRHWNDLVVQPVFLPFMHQALRYLAAFESHPQRLEIGSVVDVMRYAHAQAGGDAIVAAAAAVDLVVEAPSSSEISLSQRLPLLSLEEPGFYQVHRATPADVEVVLAANIDPVEASPEILDVERFVEEIRASAKPSPSASVLTQRQAAEYEEQQQLWYVILAVTLSLMLVEAFAANWIVRNWSTRGLVKP
jgi:hypothetical protein